MRPLSCSLRIALVASSIFWSRTRTSGATEKSHIPLQVCAYPQAGKYSEMASQRGVVNREVLISAMPDSPSNPPHFLSPLRNLLNPTVPTRSDMKISLKHFCRVGGRFSKNQPEHVALASSIFLLYGR